MSDTIDASGTTHTSENLYGIAVKTLGKCQSDFQYSVYSVVTHDTANVEKMRKMIDESENKELRITIHGCAAHILNLSEGDIHYLNVKAQVLHVIMYFRNNHFAKGSFRIVPNAAKLIFPCIVC